MIKLMKFQENRKGKAPGKGKKNEKDDEDEEEDIEEHGEWPPKYWKVWSPRRNVRIGK